MKTRKLTALQATNARVHRADARFQALRERIYQTFRSATAYARAHEPIPENHVTTSLESKWYTYTGYARRAVGDHLLTRYAQARRVLARWCDRREAILAPRRDRRIARTPPLLRGTSILARPSGRSACSEEVALWAAIRATPDEKTLWLAYADWLDEHDDARNAAEIRFAFGLRRYVGTIPHTVYLGGREAWCVDLQRRGRDVSDLPLWAWPCRDRSTRRYVVFTG